ncbi:MAG: tetratricopeptide repeat protein, partial [Bacteroidales bacterium]|nr:tetratricopeptide repeat protein [Bacteroidales bacterium]
MKKLLIVLLSVLFVANLGYGQSNKVVSAFNYHRNGKLDKAKENIDAAIENEKTMGDAKTWFYRGNIYIDIYRSDDENYKNLDPDALNKAYDSYKRAMELDEKDQYKLDILQRMPIVGEAYFNDGANKYNKGMAAISDNDSTLAQSEFKQSMNSFQKAFDIYSEAGTIDTTTIYYISVAAELAGEYDIAKENLKRLIDMDYPEPSVYSSLASIYYRQDKDVAKAEEYYALGRARFPEDLNLLLNETNVFLSEGKTEKALNNLTRAAEIDKTNPTIFFAIGAKYNEIADDTTKTKEVRNDAFVKAADAYKKSIELNPDYFDPNYNMGALYVNKAAAVIDVANQLPLDAIDEYDKMKAEADNYLKECLPYLEKANELQPGDVSTLASLKEIYTRLNMMEKLKEVNQKLSEL